jgi:uncharacterized protein (TIGR03083 family)
MDVATHIEVLQGEGDHMAAAIRAADPGAPVPTCPEWLVRDLVQHIGGVHRWATGYIAEARTEYSPSDLEALVGGWPADADMTDWFVEGHTGLVAALEAAPPDLACWTFLPAPSPRAMWARRQAHETAIHRVDAELAASTAVHGFAAPFAADGVDELLACFVPRRSITLRTDTPTTFGVRCTDDPAAWLLDIGPEGVTAVNRNGRDAACTLSGRAADLYRALWNRGGADALEVEGDPAVLDVFLEGVRVRWS